MRHVASCVCLWAFLGQSLPAETFSSPSEVTVILDFTGPHSSPSVAEMQKEATQIIRPSGVHLDWRPMSHAAGVFYKDLVVMRFKGSCKFNPMAVVYDELGPFAITRETDGEVQPFGEVNCDRVVSSLRAAMSGDDFGRADLLVGRALGRIVAHELVHMLTRSGQHGPQGVTTAALSARQLIAGSLSLSVFDIDRLRQDRKLR